MAEQCQECGASGRWGTCDEQFMSLLALDHERKQPWGRWHALNVAGYLLQHPSRANEPTLAAQWSMVQEYLAGGLVSVLAQTQRAVQQNSHRFGQQGREAGFVPAVVSKPEITIEYVSVDGSFPSEGYASRMEQWMRSIAVSRGGT